MINPLFLVSAFLSEIIGSYVGFGASTILLPIAIFIMPVKEAIVLVGIFHLFGTGARALFYVRKINLKIVVLFGLPSLLFSYLGATFLSVVDTSILTKFVGLILIFFGTYNFLREKIRLPRSNFLLISGGSLVGFLAGIVGTAGAIRGALLTSWGLSPQVYLGTGAIVGLGADLTRVIVYVNSGLASFIDNRTVLILTSVALLGTFIGRTMVIKTSKVLFSKIIFVALIIAGVRMLFV